VNDVVEEARRLRHTAITGPIGKRQSSFVLYQLLRDCYVLARRCERDPVSRNAILNLFNEQRANSRRYIEHDSDSYTLVCRYVFPTGSRSAERSNASRYATCLREAEKLQLTGADFVAKLKDHGGINALFLSRPLERTTVTTKSLRLAQAITVSKGEPFTLTLRRNADNTYEVLGQQ